MKLDQQILNIDPKAETERIVNAVRRAVRQFQKRGAVVGISGGVDSSVVLALAVRALGAERVTALILPDRDSDPESERLARLAAAQHGIEPAREEITSALDGFGCYRRRDEAVRRIFPGYDAALGDKVKIVLPQNVLDDDTLNVFSLTIISPDGTVQSKSLPPREFLQIMAASNFKQRTRMAMLYYHAELRNAAVIGTANRNEHEQGFFVKHGDAGVDFNAIVHLFKTQVYQLARYLSVPREIQERAPTSDTYSAPTTQEEFFFRLPFATMDLLWRAQESGFSPAEVASAMNLTPEQVARALSDFERKARATEYLRTPPLRVESFDPDGRHTAKPGTSATIDFVSRPSTSRPRPAPANGTDTTSNWEESYEHRI
jgi:NAD+ synthase